MKFPTAEQLEQIRQEYPPGTKVVLQHMDDSQAPPAGTIGVVKGVDDAGDLLMSWSTGSSLKVILGEDEIEKITG